ncbi:MAG: PAS domain S-box protein, partial [Pontiellaceae bacterium]|nr:PAS domain S-box protein [Pontiellaceae bacterium]
MNRFWRYSGFLTGVFFPLMCHAQAAAGPVAAGGSFVQKALFITIGVLLLLFAVSVFFLFFYRKRYIRFLTRCDELEPALKKTKEKLAEATQDLQKTSRKLNEDNLLNEQLLKGAGAGIFKLNKDGDCIYINSRLEQLIGFPMEMVVHDGLINSVHPDDRAQVQAEWKTFAERDDVCGSMYRFLKGDGQVVYVRCRGSAIRDGSYNVIGYLGILMDVTDQVNECAAHKTMEARSRYFAQEIAGGFYELRPEKPISAGLSPNEIAEKIQQTMSVFSCNTVMAEMCGLPVNELTGSRLASLAGGCGIFENVDRAREFVVSGFKLLGTEVMRKDRRGNPVHFRNDAVGIVENGFLVSIWGSQHDISRQKREIEKLNGRVEFLGNVLDTLPAEIFVKDTRCRFLYVSRGFSERTGIPSEDWIEKTVFELMPGTPRNVNKNSIEVMKTGEMHREVDSCQTKDGAGWVETLETPLASSDGLIEGVVGLSIDVTERTRRELALQKAEKQFRNLVENGPVGMMAADVESKKLTYVNPALCDFLGYTEEELLNMRVGDFHSPGSRRQVLTEWDERARNGIRFETALPCVRKDRSVVFAEVGVSVEPVEGGEWFIAAYSDASGRKKTEDELISQREYHAGVIRNSAAFVAVVNPDGTVRSMNRTASEALGFDEDELTGKSFSSALISAPDRVAVIDAFSRCSSGTEAVCECRLLAKNGEGRIAACRFRPFLDKEGVPTAFSVVGVDITEHRNREEVLKLRCDQLREQLEQSSSDLNELTGKYQKNELVLEQTTAELKRLEGTLKTRTQLFEKDISDREKLETELRNAVEELTRRKTDLETVVKLKQEELLQEADKRSQLEILLEETRAAFSRDQETFSNLVEHRTKTLELELEQRRQRAEAQTAENEALKRQQAELETELAACTKELEAQIAGRKAEENEFRKMSRELKSLGGGDSTELAKQVASFRAEVAKANAAEQVMRQQEAALQQKIKELEEAAKQQAQDAAHEAEERKKIEIELRRLGENVETDHRMVSHFNEDLRSALMPVLDLSESILKDGSLPEDQRQQFNEISRNGRRLLEILNYRLELIHLDSGAIRPNPESFDLQQFTQELEKEFSARAKSKGLFFALSCSGSVAGTVYADRAKIRRVLHALLDHALAVTNSGQVGVHAVCEELEGGRKKVGFQVMYSGLDLEKTVLAELFSVSGTKKNFPEMTDVEFRLDIIRRYAAVLGGSLRLEDPLGRKPVIRFVLPFDREPVGGAPVRNPFGIRVTQIARPQSAYVIEVKGDLLNQKTEAGYRILIEDRTDGKRSPIRFENGENESDISVVETLEINSPPVNMACGTTLSDWTVIARLPMERLQFARKGQRSLNFKVRVRDSGAVGEQNVTADQSESGFMEIRERISDIYEAIWHLIQGLRSKFPEKSEKIVGGAADFLIKEAVGWSADEQSAIFISFKKIVEVSDPSVSWEEACASHSALLREFANTNLRNDIIRLFFMLLIDENG